MHVGNVRTALYAWLFARHHGGTFILRIEDTDKKREVEGSIGHIMESLKWLGIDWDESIDIGGPHAPYIQSERLDIYKKYVRQLLEAGFAYPDPYTEADVEIFRKEAEAAKKPFLFREHRPERVQEWNGVSPIRFKTPVIKRYEWEDAVLGKLSAGEEALDDFILLKSDGFPTYNFAHIVDDIEMDVTHVMRGQEYIASMPKYLSVYDALDQKPPVFAILPPILGAEGTKKLGKRDGAKDILDYRKEGYLPEAMINFLALLGWHPSGNEEVLTKEDLIREFSLERVQKGGAQFDETKLNHLNREHMRRLSDDDFIKAAELSASDSGRLLRAVPVIRERSYTLRDAQTMLEDELSGLFSQPVLEKGQLIAKAGGKENMPPSEQESLESVTQGHLEAFIGLLEPFQEDISAEDAKAALMPYADAIPKENGGRGAALWPLRYALSGREKSPDPFNLIHILGKAESISRIRTSIGILTI